MDQIMLKLKLMIKVLPGNLIFNTNLEICIKTFHLGEVVTWIYSGITWKKNTLLFG